MKKVFNWSELHLSEVNSYKIHILAEYLCCKGRFVQFVIFAGKVFNHYKFQVIYNSHYGNGAPAMFILVLSKR